MARFDRRGLGAGLLLVTVAATMLTATAASASAPVTGATDAMLEGRVVDISGDWQDAGACLVWPEVLERPECFGTEAEMDSRIAELEKESAAGSSSIQQLSGAMATSGSACSGSLRLYDGAGYTGSVLYLRGRYQWFDLATFGFDQRTSSFKIGPCSAYLADLKAGGGSWYPISRTQAYDVAPAMIRGWNNDVSSIYIT